MDSITQATLGAAIGEAVLGKKIGAKGALLGAMIATIPDLDVVFYLFYDKLDMLSIHRGYSHSFLVVFAMAFGITALLKKMKKYETITAIRLWIFVWLALFTHLILDVFTTYGTQVFLPFSDARAGLDSINVVDPTYTIPLLLGVLAAIWFRGKDLKINYNTLGLVVSTTYLISTLGIKSYADRIFQKELASQNIAYNSMISLPVGFGGLNWYVVAKNEQGLYIGKQNLLHQEKTISFEYFNQNDSLLQTVNPILAAKMRWMSKGFYTVEKAGNNIRFYNLQIDMRGVIKTDSLHAPTAGYFEITTRPNGSFEFNSGVHRMQ